MKHYLLFATILLSQQLIAQVTFRDLSFPQALAASDKEGKYLMVVLDSRDCSHCNEVADKSFANKTLGEKLSNTFLSIRPKAEEEDWQSLAYQYEVPDGMATLFFTSTGSLLYKYKGTSSMAKTYTDAADSALSRHSEILDYNALTEAFIREEKNPDLLLALLARRKELSLSTDSLLDAYVRLLPEDSLRSIHQLTLIASYAPVLKSYADTRLRQNATLFNQAWNRIDLPDRIRINNQIIVKSRSKAIRLRDQQMAFAVARFAQATNSNSPAKQRAYQLNMMEYYKGVNDTPNYLESAVIYYNTFVMTESVELILRKDSLGRIQALASAKNIDTVRTANRVITSRQSVYRPIAQTFTIQLNRAAKSFYMLTRDPKYLDYALQWSTRALEFYKSPEALDTHARLLYVTGKKEDAIKFEDEAIALRKKMGYSAAEFEKVLENMKSGKEKIDAE
jgi:hypothetical protein